MDKSSTIESRASGVEKILWSIAIPGFGQLLNGKYFKGILLICLEFMINVNAHLNEAIVLSFQGNILDSLKEANLQWLMFYPCVYMFGIWDAYRDTKVGTERFSYLPFVCPAYFGTIGIMYSPKIKIIGHLLGPIWLPMLFATFSIAIGYILQRTLNRRAS